jgi:hypothetical protein
MWHLLADLPPLPEVASIAAVGLGTAGAALLVGRRFLKSFDRRIDELGSQAALHLAMPGLANERRTSPRRRGSCVAAHLTDDSDGEPAEVWVVDRSLGGVCLLGEAPVAVGSQLRVRPRHASDPHWTPIRVRGCQRDRDGWMIHCQFLQIPPMNVLLLFG